MIPENELSYFKDKLISLRDNTSNTQCTTDFSCVECPYAREEKSCTHSAKVAKHDLFRLMLYELLKENI
jgi:hypothetical protein